MNYIYILIPFIVIGALIVLATWRRVVIYDFQRGLLFVKGRLDRILEPGVHRYNGFSGLVERLDLRPRVIILGTQEILTADNVSVKASLAAIVQIHDPILMYNSAQNLEEVLYLHLQMGLRKAVSAVTFDELQSQRTEINEKVAEWSVEAARQFGVEILQIDVRDIIFPPDLKRAYAQIVAAQKEGQAALEKARSEAAALRSLANAARMMDNNPSLLHLRTLVAASEKSDSSFVIHMSPTELTDSGNKGDS